MQVQLEQVGQVVGEFDGATSVVPGIDPYDRDIRLNTVDQMQECC